MENEIKKLLEKSFSNGNINGAVVMSKDEQGYDYILYSKIDDIKEISPFHPVMKLNGAKIVSLLTKENDINKNFLFILKPCEIRAAIELKKLNQANLNNAILISFTCPGVFEFKEGNNFDKTNEFLEEFKKGNLSEEIRPVCQSCEYFLGEGADVLFDFFNNSFVALTPQGEDFLKKIEISYKNQIEQNSNLDKIKSLRENNASNLYKQYKNYFTTDEKIIEFFDECIKCNACREACPICYCRQCYFDSETFKYYPDSIKRKFQVKNALRLPTDKLIFQLGRVSHMATSCVACGMCEEVCPMNIKVSQFFKYMGNNIQETFEYTPGIKREETLPLLTFREDEFKEVED